MKNLSEYSLGEIAQLIGVARRSGCNIADCDIMELDIFSLMKTIPKICQSLSQVNVPLPVKIEPEKPKKPARVIFEL